VSRHLETLDSIGDAGRNRTFDPQFRKRGACLKIYSKKPVEAQCSCAFAAQHTHTTSCLCFKHFYSDLLGFTWLIGEKLGKPQRMIEQRRSRLKSLHIGLFFSNFNGSINGAD
jgi:hypothetical protein